MYGKARDNSNASIAGSDWSEKGGRITMYEYKFVKIEMKGTAAVKPKEDYRQVVQEHAGEGWRLVQVVTPPTGFNGTAEYFELIFEKQE